MSIREHTRAYEIRQHMGGGEDSTLVKIRQHSSAFVSTYVSIRQHTSAYVRITCERRSTELEAVLDALPEAYVSIRQKNSCMRHTSAYVSIRQIDGARSRTGRLTVLMPALSPRHTSAYVSIRQMYEAYVSIRQHNYRY